MRPRAPRPSEAARLSTREYRPKAEEGPAVMRAPANEQVDGYQASGTSFN